MIQLNKKVHCTKKLQTSCNINPIIQNFFHIKEQIFTINTLKIFLSD